MTENAPENSRSQSLVDALIRLRWYKYIALFLISVLFSVFASYDFEQNKFFPGDLLSGLYIAFITGLIFSIIYDLFIHSETEKANEARDEDLAKKLSKEILGAYGIEILPKPQAKLFLQSIVDDSNSLQVLAELLG